MNDAQKANSVLSSFVEDADLGRLSRDWQFVLDQPELAGSELGRKALLTIASAGMQSPDSRELVMGLRRHAKSQAESSVNPTNVAAWYVELNNLLDLHSENVHYYQTIVKQSANTLRSSLHPWFREALARSLLKAGRIDLAAEIMPRPVDCLREMLRITRHSLVDPSVRESTGGLAFVVFQQLVKSGRLDELENFAIDAAQLMQSGGFVRFWARQLRESGHDPVLVGRLEKIAELHC